MPPLTLPPSAAVLTYRDLMRQIRSNRGPVASTSGSGDASSSPSSSPTDAAAASAAASAAALARVRARVAAFAVARADRSETGRSLARLTARVGEKRRAWAAARARRVDAIRSDLAAVAAAAGGDRLVGAARDARAVAREIKEAAKERLRAAAVGGGQQAARADATFPPGDPLASLSASDAALLGTDGWGRAAVTRGLAFLCRAFMSAATDVSIVGEGATLAAALAHRPRGQALLTVSNHASALDDPLVVSALLPPGLEADPRALRWTLCATDRCFTNPAAAAFFRAGKVLPVERGAGLDQPGMRAAEALLARGDWVHVFPEGTRSKDGRVRPARKGVGRLAVGVMRAAAGVGGPPPLLVPFAHAGMLGVTPPGAVVPRPGGTVRVAVGAPISVAGVAAAHAAAGSPGGEDGLYLAVAAAVGRSLATLHAGLTSGGGGGGALDAPASAWAVDSDVLMPLLAAVEAESAAAALAAWPAAAEGGSAGRSHWRLLGAALPAGLLAKQPTLAAATPALPPRSPRRGRPGLGVSAVAAAAVPPPLPRPVVAATTAAAAADLILRALRGGDAASVGPLAVAAAYARARATDTVKRLGGGGGAPAFG